MTHRNEKLAYLLGATHGDGSFTRDGKIFFSSTDFEFVKKVVVIIQELFGININIRLKKLSSKSLNWKDSFEFSPKAIQQELLKIGVNVPQSTIESWIYRRYKPENKGGENKW
jgi:hypothetical protein